MGVEQLRTLAPRLALNLATRARQMEVVTLATSIIGTNAEPAVKARGGAKTWIEKAQETRQHNEEEYIEGALNTISCAAIAGIVEGCEARGLAAGQKNKGLEALGMRIAEMTPK
eukprot:3666954-Pyramimonas_sp.AAC.1